ncbi:unnamed protein product [Symbiodinium sp. CCMP2592]|nr:unnamed protein product [Symbiodinium sp. CCMP2592]
MLLPRWSGQQIVVMAGKRKSSLLESGPPCPHSEFHPPQGGRPRQSGDDEKGRSTGAAKIQQPPWGGLLQLLCLTSSPTKTVSEDAASPVLLLSLPRAAIFGASASARVGSGL